MGDIEERGSIVHWGEEEEVHVETEELVESCHAADEESEVKVVAREYFLS